MDKEVKIAREAVFSEVSALRAEVKLCLTASEARHASDVLPFGAKIKIKENDCHS